MTVAALIAALALCAALVALLAWQAKRAGSAMDRLLSTTVAHSELRILLAASEVAVADKDRALNIVIAERDRLQFALDTVEDQRDALLKESLDQASPGSIAIAVRDALERLRPVPPEVSEAHSVPSLSSSTDGDGH